MKPESIQKYRPFHEKFTIDLPNREWPSKFIEHAPIWCSVGLRDGNQALAIPMSVSQKLEMFRLLCQVGFKEIEIGFPSASQTEFDFLRLLVAQNEIPDDVTIQVLVQAREHLIQRTFESLKGIKKAIVHVYNSTSPLQRKITFNDASKAQIKKIAVDAVQRIKELTDSTTGTDIRLQYSPESFSDTELDYALEVCEAVLDTWEASPENPVILNLPATVEWSTPNVHADQIEWFCKHLSDRKRAIISLHTHNDRGTGIAATELGLLAGAERIEGTLFGNGERTGNLDIVTVALNMNSHGIETGLDFSNLEDTLNIYKHTTGMDIHPRHPYAGELVFTAFSGSHQDAIKKGMDRIRKQQQNGTPSPVWEVPYLTIDPEDIGRSYEAIIRINSQSGKGGVAYIIDREYGVELPKAMHPEVGMVVSQAADKLGRELNSKEIWETFKKEFVNVKSPLALLNHKSRSKASSKNEHEQKYAFEIEINGKTEQLEGLGNGPINAFAKALSLINTKNFQISDYRSQAISEGSAAKAAAYVCIKRTSDGKPFWGCSIDTSIELAGLNAVVSAANRSASKSSN